MDEIREKLLSGSRLAVDEDRRVRVGDVEREFDGTPDRRRLTDDLRMALMELRLEPHHLGAELIALESRADLIGDALDQRDVVIGERRVLAPNETDQPECLPRDPHRRDERRLAVQLRIEDQAHGEGKLRIDDPHRFAFAKDLAERRKWFDIERLVVFLDHLQNLARLHVRRRFERRERDLLPGPVEDAECAVIGSDKLDRALEDRRRHNLEIGMGVDRVGDLKKRVGPPRFVLLRDVKRRVLITDRELLRDRFEKLDLFVEPFARRGRVVKSEKSERFAAQADRNNEQRFGLKRLGKEFQGRVVGLGNVVDRDRP